MSSRVVGIDLGTTNSLVAFMDRGEPRVIPDEKGRPLLPSVVTFSPEGSASIGYEAKKQLVVNAEQTIYSIKRFMGRGSDDVKSELAYFPFRLSEESGPQQSGSPSAERSGREIVRIVVGGRIYTPPEISALILQELKRRAELFFGELVGQAVITVPAYFNDAQRQATKDAGKIAGLEVLRIVNEPTAASLAYGLQKKKEGIIAVYDLGGGTFDISILKIKEGVFEVLATNGDTHLGGDDIDRRIVDRVAGEVAERAGGPIEADRELMQAVRLAAEEAKCRLSFEATAEMAVCRDSVDYRRVLSRRELEEWSSDIVERTIPPCRQALEDARLAPEQLDEVILVGGATRMPLVRRRVEEVFGKKPHSELNPDEVVALGAAVQADILAGGIKDLLLLDVTPLSLGMETMGGVVSKLIARNTTIPASAKEMFTTFMDGQTRVPIHVVQGERELVRDCRSLARFDLKIDPMPAGIPKIEVTFLIDANGILQVRAKELRTNKEAGIEVKPSYGLMDAEVERMIEESIHFARADMSERMLIEARTEAQGVLRHAEKALAQAEGVAAPEMIAEIREARKGVEQAVAGNDHQAIRQALERLDSAAMPLAESLMSRAVKEALEKKDA